jgi:hypothetical protein
MLNEDGLGVREEDEDSEAGSSKRWREKKRIFSINDR